jgi:hypothetical protein
LTKKKKKKRRRRSRLNKAYSIEKDGVLIKILYIVEMVVKMNSNYIYKRKQ